MTLFETVVLSLGIENYYEKINSILRHEDVSHHARIRFALYCATDLDKYYNVKTNSQIFKARQTCLKLVGNYLLNPNSVTTKQLTDAAYAAAYAAANAAANAADAAANAAASAAYAAAYAAANAAASAAYAAAYAAANAANDQARYFLYLLELIGINNKLFRLIA